jgi:hypothetical protein
MKVSGQFQRKNTLVVTRQEVLHAPVPVLTQWRRENKIMPVLGIKMELKGKR